MQGFESRLNRLEKELSSKDSNEEMKDLKRVIELTKSYLSSEKFEELDGILTSANGVEKIFNELVSFINLHVSTDDRIEMASILRQWEEEQKS